MKCLRAAAARRRRLPSRLGRRRVRDETIVRRLRGARIGRLGEHPLGFDTCAYDDESLRALADITVEPIRSSRLFATARVAAPTEVGAARAIAEADVTGLDEVNAAELDRSLRLKSALDKPAGGGRLFCLRGPLLAGDLHRIRRRGLRAPCR